MKSLKSFGIIENPREIRKKLSLNQQEFWAQVGVTQSGGSRYESGRTMPKAVRELLRLVYLEQVNLEKVTGEDVAIVHLLKEKNPDIYKVLKKEVRASSK